MREVAQKHKDRLEDLKKNVEQWNSYFKSNIDRYKEFTRFVFFETLTEADRSVLDDLGKPTLEFNILEAYISRLRGEFSKQQPSMKVRAADGLPISMMTPEFNRTIEVVEAHLRALFFDAENDKLQYNIYSDLLAGGFSVMEVFTDYVNDMSFEQNIYVDRVFDPTLTGFDPLARESHKGDGKFCFQIYPKTRDEFEEEYGKELADSMKYSKDLGGFGWSYQNEKEDIILVCDYYEKQYKTQKIVKLTNGYTVCKDEYLRAIERWEEDGVLEQPPMIIDERSSSKETIVRYRFCESGMLDYTPTNYSKLPLVFVDGNSVFMSEGDTQQQVTRPYVYHAKGIQRLKNFAGQTLANELENLVQHKFMVALESIPEDYKEAYQNVQKADTLVYHHFLDRKTPEVTLPPPREVQRTPIPPEVTNTFKLSDEMTQTILGTYDSALGINGGNMSGTAIANGAMMSNTASVPYVVGYTKGLNRVAQIYVDLLPKFFRTPRSLPILAPSGKRSYEIINKPGHLYFNYDAKDMMVKVETGVNFAMQKEMALKTITSMMSASENFANFINEKGMPFLLDNIEIRGIEDLKEKAEEYEVEQKQKQQQAQQAQQQQQQMAQQAMQMQMQQGQATTALAQATAQKEMKEAQGPSKAQVDLMKVQVDKERYATDSALKEQQIENNFIETLSKVRDSQVDNELQRDKVSAENARTQVEMMETAARINSVDQAESKE